MDIFNPLTKTETIRIYLTILLVIIVTLCKSQVADFSFSTVSGDFCNPSIIKFTQRCSGNPIGYLWTFGNGQRSNAANPQIRYSNPGAYKVRLIAVYEGSTDDTTFTIFIKQSTPVNFITNRTQYCTPSSLNFNTNNTGDSSIFEWLWGDGTSPETTNQGSSSHNFNQFGAFNVQVKMTTPNGCQTSSSININITEPNIQASVTNQTGCVPVNAVFRANIIVPGGSRINNFNWNFGDGIVVNSNTRNTAHRYLSPGDFSPQLTITTTEGCVKSFQFDSLHYGSPPVLDTIYASKYDFCTSETITLHARSSLANQYIWDFGNGQTITTRDSVITHKFTSNGIMTVTVTPVFNECFGISRTMTLNISGVSANFSFRNSCDEKKRIQFNSLATGRIGLIHKWNFGDNSGIVNTDNPIHNYPSNGTYVVKYYVTDSISGCSDSSQKVIYIATPVLKNNDQSLCIHAPSAFRVENPYPGGNFTYKWQLLGNNETITSGNTFNSVANSHGVFQNRVIISNEPFYCPDTLNLNHTILVRGPQAEFSIPTNICQHDSLALNSISTTFISGDVITSTNWLISDGRIIQSNLLSPLYIKFTEPGSNDVLLIVQDNKGCKDSLTQSIQVNPNPFIRILPRNISLCQNSSANIIAYTNDSIQWQTGSNNTITCNSCDTLTILPIHSTTYMATSTNEFGCTMKDSAVVRVFEPFEISTSTSDTGVCQGKQFQFSFSPTDKKISWNTTAGIVNSQSNQTIIHVLEDQNYVLILRDSMNCFADTSSINIRSFPNPTVHFGNEQIVPYGTQVQLNAVTTGNIAEYSWSPANQVTCSYCPSTSATVTNSILYDLTVKSDSGCMAHDQIRLSVECDLANIELPTAFTPNRDGLNDQFRIQAKGIKSIKQFLIYDRIGNLMYQAHDFPPSQRIGWDGRLRGMDQSPGTYVYQIEAICEQGMTTIKKGSFLLIR